MEIAQVDREMDRISRAYLRDGLESYLADQIEGNYKEREEQGGSK